jgi:hypothetical protein
MDGYIDGCMHACMLCQNFGIHDYMNGISDKSYLTIKS